MLRIIHFILLNLFSQYTLLIRIIRNPFKIYREVQGESSIPTVLEIYAFVVGAILVIRSWIVIPDLPELLLEYPTLIPDLPLGDWGSVQSFCIFLYFLLSLWPASAYIGAVSGEADGALRSGLVAVLAVALYFLLDLVISMSLIAFYTFTPDETALIIHLLVAFIHGCLRLTIVLFFILIVVKNLTAAFEKVHSGDGSAFVVIYTFSALTPVYFLLFILSHAS